LLNCVLYQHLICHDYVNFEYVVSVSNQAGKREFPKRWLLLLIVLHGIEPGNNLEGPVCYLFLAYLSKVFQPLRF